MLRGIYRAPHIEFHPTDACNQRCRGCTYEHDDPERRPEAVAFPYDQLQRLATLEPRAVTIVGGGEPTIYREKTHDFVDLVGRLRELLPEAQFGLISNGVRLPRNSVGWANQFKWVRFSVDATVRSTYKTLRGTDDFDRVCDNLVRLLNETNIPSLGVGFVYSRCNISEASAAARFFFDLVMRQCPSALPRFNIAYRPLRRDIQHGDRSDFPEAITASDIAKVELEFVQMAKASPALEKFLREQTNCSDISLGNCHRAQRFTRCGYSTLYRLIRANGDVRPCCMRVAAPGFHLGNLLRDIPETIALNVLYNAAYLRPGCDAQGCKLCGLNRLLESEVRDEDKASIRESPFFG